MNSLLPNSYLNWRKYGKTTRPFRYDINQIPYDYTVEVRNRFKAENLGGFLGSADQKIIILKTGNRINKRDTYAYIHHGETMKY